MGDFLLVGSDPSSARNPDLTQTLRALARRRGMTITDLSPQTWLGVCGPNPPKRLHVGRWTLIGDVFDRHSPTLPRTSESDPWSYERKMTARFWGRYVGVRFGPGGAPEALMRDPSGALECVVWNQDGVILACSEAPNWLIQSLKPSWRLNIRRIAEALHDPIGSSSVLLLEGPTALAPGTVQPLPLDRPAETIWRPQDFALDSLATDTTADAAAERLRAAIDEAVSGLLGVSAPIAAEVSGGLDSSIVASSLARHPRESVPLWLHAYGDTAESDERDHVAIVARRLQIEPVCLSRRTRKITPTWLAAMAGGFRPGLAAMDQPHDREWVEHLSSANIPALMTGKGGDSILVQACSPEVFADAWLQEGWRALRDPAMLELARANEVSVWTLMNTTRRNRREGHRAPLRSHPLFLPLDEPPPLHPWLTGCEALGPSKVFQLAGAANGVGHHGRSTLTRSIDVRHPLCAQLVIETCLSLPTPLLTLGGRDRGLARHAFRDRLPHEVVDRRSKGEMTRLYGRLIANNLDVLRPWLAQGRLADLGLIDPEVARQELTPEALIWRGRYADIMVAAAFEAWVRRWESLLA